MAVEVPDKLFFKIGEVARLTGTKPYVLRYWESEFKSLKPVKGASGQRIYRKRDIELILLIKKLLYEEHFTIAGARKVLARRRQSKDREEPRSEKLLTALREVREGLREILSLMNSSR